MIPPKNVIAGFHGFCDYRCKFCANVGRGVVKWSFRQMTTDLDELWRGADSVNIGGCGEIGLLSYFDEMLDYFKARELKVCFTSNGRYLNVEKIRQSLVSLVLISLHTVDEQIYDEITGTTGNLPVVLENVRRLAERPREHNLSVVAVLTELNVRQTPQLARFCKSIGVDQLKLNPLIDAKSVGLPNGYDAGLVMQESPENLQALEEASKIMHDCVGSALPEKKTACVTAVREEDRRRFLPQKMSGCMAPKEQIVIDLKGNVSPCCFLGSIVRLGNLLQEPWETVWNGTAYEAFRSSVWDGTNSYCLKYCRNWG